MSTVAADSAFDWEKIQTELETYLAVKEEEEPRLQRWYDSVREAASLWLANAFVDSDGVDTPKPEAIKVGLFEGVRAQLSHGDKAFGANKVKTGQLEETYPIPLSLGQLATGAMFDYLWPHRLEVQLG